MFPSWRRYHVSIYTSFRCRFFVYTLAFVYILPSVLVCTKIDMRGRDVLLYIIKHIFKLQHTLLVFIFLSSGDAILSRIHATAFLFMAK